MTKENSAFNSWFCVAVRKWFNIIRTSHWPEPSTIWLLCRMPLTIQTMHFAVFSLRCASELWQSFATNFSARHQSKQNFKKILLISEARKLCSFNLSLDSFLLKPKLLRAKPFLRTKEKKLLSSSVSNAKIMCTQIKWLLESLWLWRFRFYSHSKWNWLSSPKPTEQIAKCRETQLILKSQFWIENKIICHGKSMTKKSKRIQDEQATEQYNWMTEGIARLWMYMWYKNFK